MCDPKIGATLSMGAQGLGSFLSAAGTFGNARAAKRSYQANAAYSDEQAADAGRRGTLAERRLRMRQSQEIGSQRATLAHRGFDLTTGSPLEVLTQAQQFADEDVDTLRENTRREVSGFRMQGDNYRAQASATNPWMSAAPSLIGGAGIVADRWYQYKKAGVKPAGIKKKR